MEGINSYHLELLESSRLLFVKRRITYTGYLLVKTWLFCLSHTLVEPFDPSVPRYIL
jgi:hypothetical protein